MVRVRWVLTTGALAWAVGTGAAHASLGGWPSNPWWWIGGNEYIGVLSVRYADDGVATIAEVLWLKGDDGGLAALRSVAEPVLSPGGDSRRRFFSLAEESSRAPWYLCFAIPGENDQCVLLPVCSQASGLDVVASAEFDALHISDQFRAVFLEALDDPSDHVAITAGSAILWRPGPPDPEIREAVTRLEGRADPRGRHLAEVCRVLYGDHAALPDMVRAWRAFSEHPLGSGHGWTREAIRASSQAAAIPTLRALLDDPAAEGLEREIAGTLATSGVPEALPALIRCLEVAPERDQNAISNQLSTLMMSRGRLPSSTPEDQKQARVKWWLDWWEAEGRDAFAPGDGPTPGVSPVGDPDRLLLRDVPVEVADRSIGAVAADLAEGLDILVAFEAGLDLGTSLGAPMDVRTVEDLAEAISEALAAEVHVWETGIAVRRARLAPWRQFMGGDWQGVVVGALLESLTPAQADKMQTLGTVRADGLADEVWRRVRRVPQGTQSPMMDGVLLTDIPRDQLYVTVGWEIYLEVGGAGDERTRRYLGRRNITNFSVARSVSMWPGSTGAPFQGGERIGDEVRRTRLMPHDAPSWLFRFSLDAIREERFPSELRARGREAAVDIAPGTVPMGDLAAQIAVAAGEGEASVHPDIADGGAVLFTGSARAAVEDVKLAVAALTSGVWRMDGDRLRLDPVEGERLEGQQYDCERRPWARRMAELCRRFDPDTYELWTAYSALGWRGDAGALPLALQQSIRLSLRDSAQTGLYRDVWLGPWRSGSMWLTPSLATEISITRVTPDGSSTRSQTKTRIGPSAWPACIHAESVEHEVE